MPLKRRVVSAAVALGALFMLAGCGGPQNPDRLHTAPTGPFWNGLWDGFTIPFVFLQEVFGPNTYYLYYHGASDWYLAGYVVGIVLIVYVVSWVWNRLFG